MDTLFNYINLFFVFFLGFGCGIIFVYLMTKIIDKAIHACSDNQEAKCNKSVKEDICKKENPYHISISKIVISRKEDKKGGGDDGTRK
jgi:hypothetical protein|nr:MAG: hypothetical protein [Bacteriophage sp.]